MQVGKSGKGVSRIFFTITNHKSHANHSNNVHNKNWSNGANNQSGVGERSSCEEAGFG